MEQERLPIVQQMILAPNKEERQAALDKLLPSNGQISLASSARWSTPRLAKAIQS